MSKLLLILGAVALAVVLTTTVVRRLAPMQAVLVEETTPVATEGSDVVELSEEAQENVGLEIADVKEELIRGTVEATGIVTPEQSRVAQILPLSPGIVRQIPVQLGDRVESGQPLLLYDNIELGELIAEYRSMFSTMGKLEAQREVAQRTLERAEALIEADAISRQEYDLRRAQYQDAVAGVGSQRAEMARVEEKLRRYGVSDQQIQSLATGQETAESISSDNVLRAPLGGVIRNLDVTLGELLRPDKAIFTIVDVGTVWVLADIYERDVGKMRPSAECRVTVAAYEGVVFIGRVGYVADFLDPASRTAKVRCVVPNPDWRLKLEMFATVEIPVTQKRAVAVPIGAVQQIDGQSVVFVPRDATHFEKRAVELGDQNSQWAEVASGITPGEKVVTTQSFYLKATLQRGLLGDDD